MGEAKVLITDPMVMSARHWNARRTEAAGDRRARIPEYPGTDRLGEIEYEDFVPAARPTTSGISRGRVGCDRPQLHIRHHRKPQGG